jgi:hypothetical protein
MATNTTNLPSPPRRNRVRVRAFFQAPGHISSGGDAFFQVSENIQAIVHLEKRTFFRVVLKASFSGILKGIPRGGSEDEAGVARPPLRRDHTRRILGDMSSRLGAGGPAGDRLETHDDLLMRLARSGKSYIHKAVFFFWLTRLPEGGGFLRRLERGHQEAKRGVPVNFLYPVCLSGER